MTRETHWLVNLLTRCSGEATAPPGWAKDVDGNYHHLVHDVEVGLQRTSWVVSLRGRVVRNDGIPEFFPREAEADALALGRVLAFYEELDEVRGNLLRAEPFRQDAYVYVKQRTTPGLGEGTWSAALVARQGPVLSSLRYVYDTREAVETAARAIWPGREIVDEAAAGEVP